MNPLLRAAGAGAASGCRTFTGLTAQALATPQDAVTQPDSTLRSSWARGALAVLAVQELVMDKLPRTPSRVEPLGLIARGAAAAGAGIVIARRAPAYGEVPPPTPLAPGIAPTTAAPGSDDEDVQRVPALSTAHVVACTALAVAVAVGTSYLGIRFRSLVAGRVGNDHVGAALEDSVAIGLAWWASRAP